MKKISVLFVALLFGSFMAIGQSDQSDSDTKKNDGQIEEKKDHVLEDIQDMIDSLDLEEFFEVDIPRWVDEVKPTKEEIEEMELRMKEGIDKLKDIDLSGLEEVIEELGEELERLRDDFDNDSKDKKKKI